MINILVGLGLVIIALFVWYRKKMWMDKTLKTVGTIVDVQEKKVHKADGYTHWVSVPVVSFLYQGTEHRFENEVGGTSYSNPEKVIGKSVTVLFDPQNPEKARIHSFLSLYLLEFILFTIGTLFFLSGLLLLAL